MKKRDVLIIDILLLTALIVFCSVFIFALSVLHKADVILTGDEEVAVVLDDLFPGKCVQRDYTVRLPGRVTFTARFDGEGELSEKLATRVEFDGETQYDGALAELFGKTLIKVAENTVSVHVIYTLPASADNALQNTDIDFTLTFSVS